MKNFYKVAAGIDMSQVADEIMSQPDLWNKNITRKYAKDSPHTEMSDIWVRYNDDTECKRTGDYSKFNDEHDGVWYPEYYKIPSLKNIIFDFMRMVEGERLGGVLITKTPPGGRIERHTDNSWHAGYYSKFYFPIHNKAGATFNFDDGAIDPESGDVYWFDNSAPHWVVNDSDEDRIAMIVCIRTELHDRQRHQL